MTETLENVLICPEDQSAIQIFTPQRDLSGKVQKMHKGFLSPYDEGLIFCHKCRKLWTIIMGIPRFVTTGNIDLEVDIEKLKEYKCASHIAPEIFTKNIHVLQSWRQEKNWKSDEMAFWEPHYKKSSFKNPKITHNRLLPRQKHILDKIPLVKGNKIIEIGCGKAAKLSIIPSYFLEDKIYFGTDLSFNALKAAKNSAPAGNFILCDASKLPFKNEYFDVMLGFGILHHLQEHENALHYLMTKVKPKGWMGFAEKLLSPKKVANSHIIKLFKKIFYKEDRGHGSLEYVEQENLLALLSHYCQYYCAHYEQSIVRDLLVMLIVDFMKINSLLISEIIIKFDEITIKYLKKIHPFFSPKGILFAAQKKSSI